jgi:hypothetical protein
MNQPEINLIPQFVRDRVAGRRISRRVQFAALTVGAIAVAFAAAARTIDARSAAQLAAARDSSGPVIVLEQELASLRAEQAAIVAQLETQRSLVVAIPASAVVRAVAASLPAGALLEKIDLDYANVQGTAKKIRRVGREEPAPRELRGEIAGIAANESDVGKLVDGLAALAPMSQVSLESSRSREFRGKSAREFRIHFKVDLDRRWKLPEVAGAETEGSHE